MKDPLVFRDEVKELLLDVLGEYTFGNGQSTPAICLWQKNYPPSGTEVSGLEVVITPNTRLESNALLNKGRLTNYESEILLKQWDENESTLEAIERLKYFLPNSLEISPRVLPNTVLDNIETCTLTFTQTFASYLWEQL
jgi:hypothetical protein